MERTSYTMDYKKSFPLRIYLASFLYGKTSICHLVTAITKMHLLSGSVNLVVLNGYKRSLPQLSQVTFISSHSLLKLMQLLDLA